MSTGYIRLQLSTGNWAVPITQATATVTHNQSGNVVFVGVLSVDANGQSDPIEVETPPKALSLDPNNTQTPYGSYNMTVEATGYLTAIINGIQVFEDITSWQDVSMLPADENSPARAANPVYQIPEHNLLLRGRASGSKPYVACVPLVLENPIIPNFITVHLGRPQNYAKDVTVSFRYYIKNVCCSEIYPTWPEQSIRANIYCQISLALNRVYTEWYLSKGYDFQITNSTQYDQYYVDGRSIADNVSKIVDEIFNVYVRRPGTIDPYYTEYCNGTTATCPGLSQWGTVTLANQGYSALQILKYYYGNNLELVESNDIQDIPQSYPGTPLRVGSTGNAVRTIQRQLSRIRQNFPAIPVIPDVDGVFGSATEAAVRQFQTSFQLTSDGIVGKATWYKISYIYVSVKKLAELGSEGVEPDGLPPDGTYPGVLLRLGSTGSSVEEMQYYLSTIAQFNPSIPNLSVDGIFGSGTQASVIAFQNYYGLTPDGIVGPATWDAIYAEYLSIQDDVDPPEQNYPGQYPGTPLRTGSTGSQVRRIQFWLSIVADFYPSLPKVSVDGIFGSATERAVRAFQQYFGLTVDGIVGPNTWNKIYEVYTSSMAGVLPSGGVPGTYPGTILRVGSTGAYVKEMQFYLSILADFYPSIPKIAFDGIFGQATRAAVIAFQNQFGLAADGLVGPLTWSAIYEQFEYVRSENGAVYRTTIPTYPGAPLTPGMNGTDVSTIQFFLVYIADFYNMITPIEITGTYDQATVHAVEQFQEEFSIPVTGIVDEETWLAIYDMYLTVRGVSDLGVGDPSGTDYPGYAIALGSTGPEVERFQHWMNVIAEAYCYSNFTTENGVFDQRTEEAVKLFQEGLNIPVTGIVDRQTWEMVYEIYQFIVELQGDCSLPGTPNCARELPTAAPQSAVRKAGGVTIYMPSQSESTTCGCCGGLGCARIPKAVQKYNSCSRCQLRRMIQQTE